MEKSNFTLLLEEKGEKILRRWYIDEHLSAAQIGKKVDMTGVAILRLLRKYKIPLRHGGPRLGGRDSPIHSIPIEDWAKLSIADIARKYNTDYTLIYNFYKRYKEAIDDEVRRVKRKYRSIVESPMGSGNRGPSGLSGETKSKV